MTDDDDRYMDDAAAWLQRDCIGGEGCDCVVTITGASEVYKKVK